MLNGIVARLSDALCLRRQLCAVQSSCLCRAELDSRIKVNKKTTEERRLNQTFELSSTRNYVRQALPCYSDSNVVLLLSQAKFINDVTVFWRD